jgi:hypothetical protein
MSEGERSPERRRSARIPMPRSDVTLLPAAENVQVLDISVMGVLLHSSRRVTPGVRGSLRLNLARVPFVAEVEIRRVAAVGADGGHSGYRLGAIFVGITPEHQHLIERFASQ